ncbi:MAG: TRAP transporter substrate-binding protein [Desulfobacterales bacterium]|nr:TRAP transporter substrate-binding protein [Desulfobacterales bacterium]
MKKIGFVLLVLLFICSTLITMGQQPAMAKELKLIFAHYIPPAYKDLFPPIQGFPDYINEHGKGKVHIEHFHSGTLLKSEELIPGLMQGTADIILQLDSAIMGTYPILGITELPLLYPDVGTSHEKLKIGSPLYQLINQELAKKDIIAVGTWPVLFQYIWTKDKPVRKPEDLKGLRIRVAGRVEAAVIKALGGAATTTSSAELYEALQRGTVDGVMCTETTIISRSLQDVVKYVTKPPLGAYSGQIYMRRDKWESLSPDIQKLFIESGKNSAKGFLEYSVPFWNTKIWPTIRKAGVKEIALTKEEQQEFKKRVEPVWDWWKGLLPPGVGEKAIKLATE